MGDQKAGKITDKEARAGFTKHLLGDMLALEMMLEQNLFEKGITRIGAEQEFCLINQNWRPSTRALEILEAINDPHFTTELARFNLEVNLDPVELGHGCFSDMESSLNGFIAKARTAADKQKTKVILAGILPTISRRELQMSYLTPLDRYKALNEVMKALRGSHFELHILGVDELTVRHDSVLFEGCNTSFQLHLQIDPDDFVSSYNWAQAIAGLVLAVCANSPLLLGRELWKETRIALFQQSIDTRSSSYALKEQEARVSFGNSWLQGSIVDLYKDDLARFKVILGTDIETDSVSLLQQGHIPKLRALNLHNGTIYRWNRPCYGITNGKPHLRIENRYLPAGPSVVDEMANFAFWVGLMKGRPKSFDDMSARMDFQEAKANFIKAARTGKESVMSWNGSHIAADQLVTKELLPIAQSGLEKASINQQDIDRYLTIIDQRTKGQTGAQWQVANFRKLRKEKKRDDVLLSLTSTMYGYQLSGQPVSEWPMIDSGENPTTLHKASELVGHIMSTQLFTVIEDDLASMAVSIMQWKNIHHLPVEDNQGRLCGLLTWTHLNKFQNVIAADNNSYVSDIMIKIVITTRPEVKITKAIKLMKEADIGCLPVIENDILVGIITVKDLISLGYA
jgi:CBS domain-containing protein